MRWKPGHRSQDIEDRRGSGGRARRVGAIGAGGAILALLISVVLGKDVSSVLQAIGLGGKHGSPQASQSSAKQTPLSPANDPDKELVAFVSFVLDDIQATWVEQFKRMGKTYQRAKLVLFTDSVDSACGFQSAATGPFYCPPDKKAFIDLSFYRALSKRLGAPGDFAQAYVLAHEIAHHVQNLLGYSRRMRTEQRRNPKQKNELSIKLELQADCLAGVWAHHTNKRNILERGDIEEGLTAAAAIGDDKLQRDATGTIRPETWTHGSSAQRVRWFKRGLSAGDVSSCDTFKNRTL